MNKIILFLFALVTTTNCKPSPPRTIKPSNPHARPLLSPSDRQSVLIIGCGIAGLSSALELAERGFHVTIKESKDHCGGKLDTQKVSPLKDDPDRVFHVEHGFHAWFHNYFNFDNILTRLDLQKNFKPWDKVDYIFRNYKPESIYSEGEYPLNLLGILTRSPNIKLQNILGTAFALPDLAFFNYDTIYQKYDNLTFTQWAQQKHVDKTFYDIIMDPAISVTLNDHSISAADMITLMHIYFLSSPRADKRKVAIKPYNEAVIDPWVKHLEKFNVDIQLSSPVKGLIFKEGKAYKEVFGRKMYDWVIVAADLGAVQSILSNSVVKDAGDEKSAIALELLTERINHLKVANPYKVLRVWFDGMLDDSHPDILETPEHHPINLVAQYHLLEDESMQWSNQTGGSILEFHLYNLTPQIALIESPEEIWAWMKSVAYEIYPQLHAFTPLGFNLNGYANFAGFGKGMHRYRPGVEYPSTIGLENLALAGDWVQTEFPSFIMERAVSTGRLAANFVLRNAGVREAELVVVSSHGPGLPIV